MEQLKKFLNKIYKKYCGSDNIYFCYLSSDKYWQPIIRQTREISLSKFPVIVKEFLNDVDEFKTNITPGLLKRKGYLLSGDPGCGKTTSIEYISMEYHMAIYMVNLNASQMTDTKLINLISKIPSNSLIVFEEIDRQLDTIKKNKRIHISDGGILTAIDGPQRISSNSIIIMTTNNQYNLSANLRKALLRKGRIDKVYDITPLSLFWFVLLLLLLLFVLFICIYMKPKFFSFITSSTT